MTHEAPKKSNLKTGLYLWIASCALPSTLTSYIEMLSINEIPGFHMSTTSVILIALILTIITMIYSSPVVAFVLVKLKRKTIRKVDRFYLNLFFLAYSVLVLSFNYYLSASWYEALYLTLPCVFLTLISLNIVLLNPKRQDTK